MVAVSTTQSNLTWDGSTWVPTVASVAAGGTVTPKSALVTEWGCNRDQSIPPNPIATYTDYYHKWNAKFNEQEKLLKSLPPSSPEIPAVQRQLEWYKYYADQSSRAAHYFHSHGETNVTQAPFDLPPEPPQRQQQQQQHEAQSTPQPTSQHTNTTKMNVSSGTQWTSTTSHNVSAKGSASVSTASSSSVPPDSLKRYVDRCLSQYESSEDKAAVMKIFEGNIQKSLMSGTMHSTNWDTVPLIQLPRKTTTTASKTRLVNVPSSSQSKDTANVNVNGKNFYETNLTRSITPSRCSSSTSSGSNNDTHNSSNTTRRGRRSRYRSKQRLGSTSNASYPSPSRSSENDSSHYGPSSTTKKRSLDKRSGSGGGADWDDNYYGPSSVSSSHNSSHSSKKVKCSHMSSQSEQSSASLSEDFIPLTNKTRKGPNYKQSSRGFNSSSKSMSDRAKRFSGPGGIQDSVTSAVAASKIHNLGGAWDRYMGKATIGGSSGSDGGSNVLDEADYENMKVKGTCTVLEKDYLRLTAPPKPERVRPQRILEQHLSNLKAQRASAKSSGEGRDHLWFCSQLKAVRQDLMVQHLTYKNAFAVDVYETHARIALEEGDLNEFNQCQTQLKELYRSFEDDTGEVGKEVVAKALENRSEFLAYRLLYYVFMAGNQKYGGGSSDLFRFLLSLTKEERTTDAAINHALQVREAIAENDYHAFFKLRRNAPRLGGLLMNQMVPELRYSALQMICKAYRPEIEVAFVLKELGFVSDAKVIEDTIEYGTKWVLSCGCVLSDDGLIWLTKDTTLHESKVEEKHTLI